MLAVAFASKFRGESVFHAEDDLQIGIVLLGIASGVLTTGAALAYKKVMLRKYLYLKNKLFHRQLESVRELGVVDLDRKPMDAILVDHIDTYYPDVFEADAGSL